MRVVEGDFLSLRLPTEPFRVIGSLPFGYTTDVLRRLLDDPRVTLKRADLIVQWAVARKRVVLTPFHTPLHNVGPLVGIPPWSARTGFGLPTCSARRFGSPYHYTP